LPSCPNTTTLLSTSSLSKTFPNPQSPERGGANRIENRNADAPADPRSAAGVGTSREQGAVAAQPVLLLLARVPSRHRRRLRIPRGVRRRRPRRRRLRAPLRTYALPPRYAPSPLPTLLPWPRRVCPNAIDCWARCPPACISVVQIRLSEWWLARVEGDDKKIAVGGLYER
jgi:hypothetical protein